MKRIIAALLAALCILPLAACASNPATADTTAADTTAASALARGVVRMEGQPIAVGI